MNDGFQYPRTLCYRPITSTAVILQNSCHPSNVFIRFYCFQPSAPLCIFNQLLTHHKLAVPSKYCSTWHGPVTKRFYKHFPHFCSHKPRFITTFYRGTLFKIFSMVIYNMSTGHTILQNALILSHMDGLTSNLVCRWRRVYVATSQIFVTIAPLVLIFEAQSQNLWNTLCIKKMLEEK